jgi:predicted DNA-binding WGR domain protein
MQWFAERRQAETVFRRLAKAKRRRGYAEPPVAAPWCVVET